MKKACQVCGILIQGRSDKKFCTSDCRSHHHNVKNQKEKKIYQKINKRLIANRNILQKLHLVKIKKISRLSILKKGFDFDYLTHISFSKTGKKQFFCYEYGYSELKNDQFRLIKTEEHQILDF